MTDPHGPTAVPIERATPSRPWSSTCAAPAGAVRPAYRRRAYSTRILRQGVVMVRGHEIDMVLATYDDDNLASTLVNEHRNGVL